MAETAERVQGMYSDYSNKMQQFRSRASRSQSWLDGDLLSFRDLGPNLSGDYRIHGRIPILQGTASVVVVAREV
jgi:hypothetical protein